MFHPSGPCLPTVLQDFQALVRSRYGHTGVFFQRLFSDRGQVPSLTVPFLTYPGFQTLCTSLGFGNPRLLWNYLRRQSTGNVHETVHDGATTAGRIHVWAFDPNVFADVFGPIQEIEWEEAKPTGEASSIAPLVDQYRHKQPDHLTLFQRHLQQHWRAQQVEPTVLLTRLWCRVLDSEGKGSVNLPQFRRACDALGYKRMGKLVYWQLVGSWQRELSLDRLSPVLVQRLRSAFSARPFVRLPATALPTSPHAYRSLKKCLVASQLVEKRERVRSRILPLLRSLRISPEEPLSQAYWDNLLAKMGGTSQQTQPVTKAANSEDAMDLFGCLRAMRCEFCCDLIVLEYLEFPQVPLTVLVACFTRLARERLSARANHSPVRASLPQKKT